jgi:hypothetical protein
LGRVVPLRGSDVDPEDATDGPDPALESAFLELMDKSVEDILREGQKALFARLVAVCRSGSASHQELAILRNILKDNGLTLGIPPEAPSTGNTPLPLPIPEYGEPED